MRLLSDSIEQFIKALMEDETQGIELRRNELAEHFSVRPRRSITCWRQDLPLIMAM